MTETTQRLAELSPQKREQLYQMLAQNAQRKREQAAGPQLVPLPADGAPLPLSFAQQRLWFLDQLAPASPLYNIPYALRLKGPLHTQALRRSLQEIVRRHAVLRTTFEATEQGACQVIAPQLTLTPACVDLAGLPEEQRAAELEQRILQECRRPFDLSRGPLIQVTLFHLQDNEHVMLVMMHHSISDGWSRGIFLRELALLYSADCQGRPSPLPELPVQYADFASWQRAWLDGEVLARQLAYWRQQLHGAPAILELPTDHPVSAEQSYQGATRWLHLSPELTRALRELSRRESATLFMTLLTALNILLARTTGRSDIVVGTDVANRTRREVENLIGFFVNQLVIRTDLSAQPTFQQALRRVREGALGAYAHQDLPFEKLVQALAPQRDPRYHPLFQVSFVLQNVPASDQDFPGLRVEPVEIDSGIAKLLLDFSVEEQGEQTGLAISLRYRSDLFEAETIERMLQHYQALLVAGVANPQQPIATLPMLTAQERHQLLYAWNASRESASLPTLCFPQLFEARALRTPQAPAVSDAQRTLSYQELNRLANQAARALRAAGVGPEVLVALPARRSPELLIAILAIFKAGGAYLPLDPSDPPARLRDVLVRSGSRYLLAPDELLPMARALLEGEGAPAPASCQLYPLQTLLAGPQTDENPAPRLSPRNLAYVMYTSGSTGAPKGAMIEQQGMLNHLQAKIALLGLQEGDRVPQTASPCFDISVWQLLAPLLAGGTVLIPPEEITHEPLALLPYLAGSQATVFEVVPSVLQIMLEASDQQAYPALDRLRWLISTGELLLPGLCQRWQERYPGIAIINTFGATECSDDVTHSVIAQALPPTCTHTPLGHPIAHMQQYILDRHLEPVPIGVCGEVYFGGVGVGRGYLADATRTAQVFLPDPLSNEPGARLYKTGDLARFLPDGNPVFLGRVDDQVKVRGRRIELGEIEAALARHPAIGGVAVAVRDDVGVDRELVAYVTRRPGTQLNAGELQTFARQALPVSLLPAFYVELEALPLNANGKIERRALPAPERHLLTPATSFIAPRTALEQVVARVWAELLGQERVGLGENFFDLGGHSLLATRLVARLRSMLRTALPLHSLFASPTVAGLAQALQEHESVAGQLEKIAQIILRVESMSPQEMAQHLQQSREEMISR
ncbi:MAG TPA: amino acid adenylation domain-containing protein [Ktedonobacteraceae bacterium]|jgi:amino acid adenylation domain-containing protein